MARRPAPKHLRLVTTRSTHPTIIGLATDSSDERCIKACLSLLDKLETGLSPKLVRCQSALADEASFILNASSIPDHSIVLSNRRTPPADLLSAWRFLSLAPFMEQHGEGTDILVLSVDYAGLSKGGQIAGRLALTVNQLIGRRDANVTVLTNGAHNGMGDVSEALSLALPAKSWKTLSSDTGIAAISSSPTAYDIVLVDAETAPVLNNILSDMIGHVGYRPVVRVNRANSHFEAECIRRIKHVDVPKDGRFLALLQSATLLLTALGQPNQAALLHNALMATIEDRLLPAHTSPTFSAQRELAPDAFADAVSKRLGRRPLRLPEARLAPVDSNLSTGSSQHLRLVH